MIVEVDVHKSSSTSCLYAQHGKHRKVIELKHENAL